MKIVIGCLLFVMIGLMMAGVFRGWDGGPVQRILGWTTTVTFGLFGLATLKRLSGRQTQLVIDARGIQYRPWTEKVIPWSQIIEIGTAQGFGKNALLLYLRNPERFPWTTMPKRPSPRAGAVDMKGDVIIPIGSLNCGLWDVLAAVERYRP